MKSVLLGWPIVACASALVLAAGYAAVKLSDVVRDGGAARFDEWAIRALRHGSDPATPIGPAWLREASLDVTALGSHVIVLLVSLAVGIFLALRRRWPLVWLVLAATAGAMLLSAATKHVVGRDRPDVVPHLREVTTPSFPSGHATLAASVYLTLGAVMARAVRGRYTRAYCLASAAFVVVCVGVSRVYLGVHFPTDVLAGWAMGALWALTCWGVAGGLAQRGGGGRLGAEHRRARSGG